MWVFHDFCLPSQIWSQNACLCVCCFCMSPPFPPKFLGFLGIFSIFKLFLGGGGRGAFWDYFVFFSIFQDFHNFLKICLSALPNLWRGLRSTEVGPRAQDWGCRPPHWHESSWIYSWKKNFGNQLFDFLTCQNQGVPTWIFFLNSSTKGCIKTVANPLIVGTVCAFEFPKTVHFGTP